MVFVVVVVDVEGFLFTLLSLHRTCRRTIQLYRNKVQILIYDYFPQGLQNYCLCHLPFHQEGPNGAVLLSLFVILV